MSVWDGVVVSPTKPVYEKSVDKKGKGENMEGIDEENSADEK